MHLMKESSVRTRAEESKEQRAVRGCSDMPELPSEQDESCCTTTIRDGDESTWPIIHHLHHIIRRRPSLPIVALDG